MNNILKKFKYDRKVVRDSFHSLSTTQKIWLVILVISTVTIITKIANKVLERVNDTIYSKKNKEVDHSDECPDYCEEQDDDEDNIF